MPEPLGAGKFKTGWSGMKFGKRYSKATVFMAMLHGVALELRQLCSLV